MGISRAKTRYSAAFVAVAVIVAVYVWLSAGDECWTASCERARIATQAEANAVAEARLHKLQEQTARQMEDALRNQARLVDELSGELERAAAARASTDAAGVDRREASYNSYKHIYSYNGTGMMEAFQIEEEMRNQRAAILSRKADAIELTLKPRRAALDLLERLRESGSTSNPDIQELAMKEGALTDSFRAFVKAVEAQDSLPASTLKRYTNEYNTHQKAFRQAADKLRDAAKTVRVR
jgi:hypothetical protein